MSGDRQSRRRSLRHNCKSQRDDGCPHPARCAAAAGCAFAYHGDFDWPGIALANRVVEVLTGPRVEAGWDGELAPAMEALGIALHEEAALDLLLEDLG
ncbi:DUF2399 domain-containing protein [Streptomyces sp. NPDC093982]|uniref:DUF2399 domain-containing protein n=1 Tax=Streptomyces sp. NPDC093982 TaxID=3155077 RepID=UPI00343CDFA3